MHRPRICWILLATFAICAAPALRGAGGPPDESMNVVQDCWTARVQPPAEQELYDFPIEAPIFFTWKHKLLQPCSRYSFRIVGFPCREGKPRPRGADIRFDFREGFGPIDPIPEIPEQLLTFAAPPGSIPPGRYDWMLITECNDLVTPGIPLGADGDLDDECGINVGFAPTPLLFGPEPAEVFDAMPGGSPPGRGPGEEGTTRPWCFEVRQGQ